MKKTQYFIFAVAALFVIQLSSCYVTREYQKPEVNTENLFRTDQLADDVSEAIDNEASLADVSWRELFTDNLLQKYIETALANNIDVRVAVKNIETAAAYVEQAKAAYLPSVMASLDYGHIKNSKNSQPGATSNKAIDQFNLGANLSWEADIWGKIKSQERSVAAGYLQTVEAHKAIKTRLVSNIATIYYQLMALSEQMAVANRTIASRDSALATTKALKLAGYVTEVAVKQTEAQLYDARLILVNLKQRERALENAFCLLMNEPAHPVDRNSITDQKIETPLRLGVPANLLANRPDVKQAEYSMMQAFELTNIAKTNFYPSLTITAGGGLKSVDIKNWISINSLFGNIAGGLLQPVFARKQIRTAYEVAQIQEDQALLYYEQSLLRAGNDVSNALYDYQMQNETIDWQEKQLDAYNKAVDYSEQLLINGLANYLEVLTARQAELATQLNLINSQLARLTSIVNLYEALGGGWK